MIDLDADRPRQAGAAPQEAILMAVVMERQRLKSAWQPFAWKPVELLLDAGEFGSAPRCLSAGQSDGADAMRWLFPNLEVGLYRDEAENYYLNATAPEPCAFVMWRVEPREADGATFELAVPQAVSLSYGEASRWLDSGEQVEPLPLAPALHYWLDAYVTEHYVPEQKQRRRPQSFLSPEHRAKK